ncbi:hypothetical protein GCM10009860_16730 [Microbacterium mitrae]|uniref:FtsQ-type POTRA domain-containing protein n=1 Tax=Microbacterium mitrae TaxID=664640 RepID=A0A5C8HQM8_9MICO|nr:FtsQ-type POTRA domain-containing protein [Microbacterium mitrae]TXK04763.1 FtsQ-type POTRA domain-containing protein [Microbacterium mitrae]
MRRPDPLPQRPRVEAPVEPVIDPVEVIADEPVAIEDALSDEGELSVPEADAFSDFASVDEIDTAVITPLRRGRGEASGGASEDPIVAASQQAGSTDDGAPDADAEPDGATAVGWRDVWRAARAKRKALRREVRRFTGRARRRRLVWIVSLSALAAVIVGSFVVAYSPLFAVQKITIAGTTSLDPAAVTDALSDQIGTPLALVSDSAIKAALVTFPAVETYTVQARPPHELVVTIVERTPVGVVQTDAGYSLVDAAGVVLSTTPEPPAGYPAFEVAGGLGERTFLSAGMVMLSIPASIRTSVVKVTATTPADVTLTLAPTGTQIIWGNADDSQIKAATLEKAMLARPIDTVSVYDVSSPTAIVMR